jgi:hypothetical protein
VASPDKKAFLLRIDTSLWSELERLAAADLRSVNARSNSCCAKRSSGAA